MKYIGIAHVLKCRGEKVKDSHLIVKAFSLYEGLLHFPRIDGFGFDSQWVFFFS